ncbi:hypothetical protein FKN01_13655 [Streptomyces sp. 130]|uniref:hypothetical protein n=1 Tax=Streptomyces sp. 130 TaxID=2591006 RepID=UPI0011813C9F|nr:hypothetical protein [Streptomyces sp. 130]TRV77956.1 hypothetical protein FKN01_13655 [Streptomyces sp. 130]
MADLYELLLALDLRDSVSDADIAELRWHLGLGAEPEDLGIITVCPEVREDDSGEPFVEERRPEPLLTGSGPAWKIGGALVSVLTPPATDSPGTWALTVRQEIHPDEFDLLGELLGWLAAHADDRHRSADGAVRVGWTRFYEADRFDPLVVQDDEVRWP